MVQLRTLRKTCTCTFYEHACLEIRSDNWKFNGRGMNFANCVGFQMRWNLREKTALGLAIFAFFIKFCNKRKRLLSRPEVPRGILRHLHVIWHASTRLSWSSLSCPTRTERLESRGALWGNSRISPSHVWAKRKRETRVFQLFEPF